MLYEYEWKIDVPWGKLSLLSRGHPDGDPVFLVHGRQDSASVFGPLLEMMTDSYYFVALDMPGNGLSDAFPHVSNVPLHPSELHHAIVFNSPPKPKRPFIEHSTYNQKLLYKAKMPWGPKLMRFHFLYAMELALMHLGWDEFIFMGHSMGCEQGLFYNVIYPKKITKMILLDAGPTLMRMQIEDPVEYQKTFIESYYDNYHRENFTKKLYTKKSAIEALKRQRDLNDEECADLLERNFHEIDNLNWLPIEAWHPNEARFRLKPQNSNEEQTSNEAQNLNKVQIPNKAQSPNKVQIPNEAQISNQVQIPNEAQKSDEAQSEALVQSVPIPWHPNIALQQIEANRLNMRCCPCGGREVLGEWHLNEARRLSEARQSIEADNLPGTSDASRLLQRYIQGHNSRVSGSWKSCGRDATNEAGCSDEAESSDEAGCSGEAGSSDEAEAEMGQVAQNTRDNDQVGYLSWDNRLKSLAPQNYGNAYYFELFKNIPPTLLIAASDGAKNIKNPKLRQGAKELLEKMESLENFHRVDVEGSHDVHYTHPERVVPHIIRFLNDNKMISKL